MGRALEPRPTIARRPNGRVGYGFCVRAWLTEFGGHWRACDRCRRTDRPRNGSACHLRSERSGRRGRAIAAFHRTREHDLVAPTRLRGWCTAYVRRRRKTRRRSRRVRGRTHPVGFLHRARGWSRRGGHRGRHRAACRSPTARWRRHVEPARWVSRAWHHRQWAWVRACRCRVTPRRVRNRRDDGLAATFDRSIAASRQAARSLVVPGGRVGGR